MRKPKKRKRWSCWKPHSGRAASGYGDMHVWPTVYVWRISWCYKNMGRPFVRLHHGDDSFFDFLLQFHGPDGAGEVGKEC